MKYLGIKYLVWTILLLFPSLVGAEWKVDFTRRAPASNKTDLSPEPTTQVLPRQERSMFTRLFDASLPVQDIVILNTEQGFIPSTVRVREGAQYRVVVVNVNEKSKNISFVMDSFSEHHATYYGKLKTFYIEPKKEGVYTFISPETSAQGRLVVHPAPTGLQQDPLPPTVELRSPASR